jgi:hypothetical protein
MNRFLTLLPMLLVGFGAASANQDYPAQIKPLIEQRCMVCHGCYDAPCQLKMDAFEGVDRGAHKDKVYVGTRLKTATPTRLLVDAQSTEQWRDKGFYPVLAGEDYRQGQLYRMLQLKQQHPLPAGSLLPDSFDFSLNRDQQCPKPAEMDRFERNKPLWGMPYGLPGLNSAELSKFETWLSAGAPGEPRPELSREQRQAIERWEKFFNGDSNKEKLMSRYIYEHLYIGALYFSELPTPGFFELVRSSSPPGTPIQIIPTRRPFDSPGRAAFYYRIQPVVSTTLVKRHMPYALNAARIARWQKLFLEPEYEVSQLPSYAPEDSANPFKTFRDLPVDTRYRFMLEEAHFTIMGFIKGTVCRGQIAINVIDDHFWVMFIDPEIEKAEIDLEFLASQEDNLMMPAADKGSLGSVVGWGRYAAAQRRFLEAKSKALQQIVDDKMVKVDMDLIWDGGADNDNASLTIFRHFDSASVHKGMIGQVPKTSWVIGYSLLERIHYLLVAGFDVYGNVGHQWETRMYMDFLRMEGEYNFLVMLPEDERIALRDHWYRGASERTKEYVLGRRAWFNRDTDIAYQTDDAKTELLLELRQRLYGAAVSPHEMGGVDELLWAPLVSSRGRHFSLLPETAFVDVIAADGNDRVYTLVRNSGLSNVAQMFQEDKRRLPEEDYVTVSRGFVGYYPNAFFQVAEKELSRFVQSIMTLESESDYRQLMDRYGVRRNATYFWKVSDRMHEIQRQQKPKEAGLFDLNRYQNR